MNSDLQLNAGEIHQIMAIVREVLDRWDDPPAWRAALLSGACNLLQGNIGTMTGQQLTPDGRMGHSQAIAVHGLSDAMRKQLFEPTIHMAEDRPFEEVETAAPGMKPLFETFLRDGWTTCTRGDITDDQTYYASQHHAFRSQANCDDYLISIRAVDEPHRVEVMTVDRPTGATRFTPRDVLVLKFLHDEIAPLIGVRLATEEHLCRDGLSARLRGVLNLLLEGKAEKEIAAALDLALPTIHQYIGRIYRHFNVNTRAEMMAYFVRRQPRLRPQE